MKASKWGNCCHVFTITLGFIYLSCEVTRKSVKAFSFLDMIAYTCATMQKYWGIHYNLQFRCFYGKKKCDISLIKWKTTLDIKEIYKVGKKKLLVFLCVHVQSVFSDRNQCLCNKYSLYKDLVEGQSPQYRFNSVPPLFLSQKIFLHQLFLDILLVHCYKCLDVPLWNVYFI